MTIRKYLETSLCMAIAYREASPEARRPEPKFAFRGTDNGITSLTMNEMWALTPKRDTRI
jgi:hypothetical protein